MAKEIKTLPAESVGKKVKLSTAELYKDSEDKLNSGRIFSENLETIRKELESGKDCMIISAITSERPLEAAR